MLSYLSINERKLSIRRKACKDYFGKFLLFISLLLVSAGGFTQVPGKPHGLVLTPDFEVQNISGVDAAGVTIPFINTYANPVPVCTYNIVDPVTEEAATVRISNLSPTGMTIRLQGVDGLTLTPGDVQCIILDEGEYTVAADGFEAEARLVLSEETNGNGDFDVAETEDVTADVTGNYAAPVVLGQVVTSMQPEFSTFWSNNCVARGVIPFEISDRICVGKHDSFIVTGATDFDETVGYIIFEEATGILNGVSFEVEQGADSISGVDNPPGPYNLDLGVDYNFAVATQAGEDGGNGGWAVFLGPDPLAGGLLDVAIDEANNGSRRHTTEEVHYIAFAASKITLEKTVINDDGGDLIDTDFTLTAEGPEIEIGTGTGTTTSQFTKFGVEGDDHITHKVVYPDTYALSESIVDGYAASAWTCTDGTLVGDDLTLEPGDDAVCTITNNDIPATLTLIKTITNDDGGEIIDPDAFLLTIDGVVVDSGVATEVAANTALAIDETVLAGYEFESIAGPGCPAALGGTITIDPDAFLLTIDGTPALSGAPNSVAANTALAIDETVLAGYEFESIAGPGCPAALGGTITLDPGADVTCTITNNDVPSSLTIVKEVINTNGGTPPPIVDFDITTDAGDLIFNGGVAVGDVTTFTSTPLVVGAATFTLSEIDNPDYIEGAWSCIGAVGAVVGTFNNGSVEIANDENVTCTISNTRITPTLLVNKVLVPATDPGTFLIDANGTLGTAAGDGATSSATVNSGDTVTFGETAQAGTDLANYNTTFSCDNGESGDAINGSFAMPNEDVICTITNTRQQAIFQLEKVWVDALVGEEISATTTGLTNNATITSVADVADETDTGVGVTVFAGEVATLPLEVFAIPANAVNYSASDWQCDDSANTVVTAGDTLTIASADMGTTITCTITNTRGDRSFTATKTQTSIKSPVDSAGDIITYEIVLVNDGLATLNNVVVTDTLPDGTSFDLAGQVETGGIGVNGDNIFDIDETWTYTTSYTVTQDDINAGLSLVNAISAVTDETTADGDGPLTDTAITPVAGDPNFTLTKTQTSAQSPVDTAGDVITYDIVLFNDGMLDLTNVVATDTLPDGTIAILTAQIETGGTGVNGDNILNVGETWTFSTSYTVSQEDINAGLDLTNLVSVVTNETTADGDGPLTDTAITPVAGDPNFTLTKTQTSAQSPVDTAGDVITYDIVLFNDGMLDLTNVVATDTLPDGTIAVLTGQIETGGTGVNGDNILNVGETWTFGTSYEVTADDLNNAADLVNTVSVVTTQTPDPAVDTAVTPLVINPSLVISKQVTEIPRDLGDGSFEVTFNMVVENDGNVDITNLQIEDDLDAALNNPTVNSATVDSAVVSFVSGTPLTPNGAFTGNGDNGMLTGVDSFPAGSSSVLSLSFVFTPAETTGPFFNTATASGADPLDDVVSDDSEDADSPTAGADIDSPTFFTITVPTVPISLGSFSAVAQGETVLFNWVTQTEVANIGFNLYARVDGEWVFLNDELILSQGDSVSLQNYEFSVATDATVFSLSDLDVNGNETLHGPFSLGASHGAIGERRDIDWRGERAEREAKQDRRKARREARQRQRIERKMREMKEAAGEQTQIQNEEAQN